nr:MULTISPECIES: DUF6134 family protein [unclassified Minwuia]
MTPRRNPSSWPATAILLAVLLVLMTVDRAARAATAHGSAFDPLVMYGSDIRFSVWRKDRQIGTHTVQFRRDGDLVDVQIDFRARVKFLGITAYRFEYGSSSVWDGAALQSLDASVNDDGTQAEVSARRFGGEVVVDGSGGLRRVEGALFPSNHWHPGIIGQTRVLNTLTGHLASVSINAKGQERVETAHGYVMADRYLYTGDLHDVDVWYDAAGRWVKLRFLTKGGERIEYRCEKCRAAEGLAERTE